MKKNEIVIIPYGEKAKLHLRRDRIIATVSEDGSDHIDIYTSYTPHPWHISGVPADAINGLIWGDE